LQNAGVAASLRHPSHHLSNQPANERDLLCMFAPAGPRILQVGLIEIAEANKEPAQKLF